MTAEYGAHWLFRWCESFHGPKINTGSVVLFSYSVYYSIGPISPSQSMHQPETRATATKNFSTSALHSSPLAPPAPPDLCNAKVTGIGILRHGQFTKLQVLGLLQLATLGAAQLKLEVLVVNQVCRTMAHRLFGRLHRPAGA